MITPLLIIFLSIVVILVILLVYTFAEMVAAGLALKYLQNASFDDQIPLWVFSENKEFSSIKALKFHLFGGPTKSIAQLVDEEKGWNHEDLN